VSRVRRKILKNHNKFKPLQTDTNVFHSTFIERIGTIYQKKRDFYALAYDRDEVIDAVSQASSG
jgi:hypothetical protein